MEFEKIRAQEIVQRYLDKPVEEKKIEQCLEAAHFALLGKDKQCCQYIIVRDRDMISKIANDFNSWAKSAPIIIVACGGSKLSESFNGLMQYFLDVGIATKHLVSEAASLGLSTCLFEFFNEKKVKDLLKIPEDIRVIAITPLGYSCQSKGVGGKVKVAAVSKDRKNLDDIAHDGEWGRPFGKPSKRK